MRAPNARLFSASLLLGCLPEVTLALPDSSVVDAHVVSQVDAVATDAPALDVLPVDVRPSDGALISDASEEDASAQVACDGAFAVCAGTCTDLSRSRSHCGRCGRSCREGESCEGAECVRQPQRSCVDGPIAGCGLAVIPEGELTMGDMESLNASPVQTGVRTSGFWVDRFPVTVDRFEQFVRAGMPSVPSGGIVYPSGQSTVRLEVTDPPTMPLQGGGCNWGMSGRSRHPINCVDWSTAQAFCYWDGGRLPTEAERERAARSDEGRIWPWGNRDEWARVCSRVGGSRTATCAVDDPVFADGQSAQRVWHLVGNVWEWVADYWSTYRTDGSSGACANRSALLNPLCANGAAADPRVARGGAWVSSQVNALRAASREAYVTALQRDDIGFRCVRSSL